jgi:hypothetical protein
MAKIPAHCAGIYFYSMFCNDLRERTTDSRETSDALPSTSTRH